MHWGLPGSKSNVSIPRNLTLVDFGTPIGLAPLKSRVAAPRERDLADEY
jgi:hypothetical protein